MIIETHMAFSLTLLALLAGAVVLGSLDKLTPCCKMMAKIAGYLTVVLSVLQLFCLSYVAIKNCSSCDKDAKKQCSRQHGDMGTDMMPGKGPMMHGHPPAAGQEVKTPSEGQ